jgi:hypothetical protein
LVVLRRMLKSVSKRKTSLREWIIEEAMFFGLISFPSFEKKA